MERNAKLDLFTPIVPDEKQHPNFKNTLRYPKCVLETLEDWTKGFPDRDKKIIKEFQTTYNSSFWEFYLHACLKELNFEFDFTYDRPDFLVSKNGARLILEATTANNPQEGAPEHDRTFEESIDPKSIYQIIHLATLRLFNSIFAKHKKYVESYSKLDHVSNKPFIICVAPFEQPYFYAQADTAIRRVLYKFNAPIYNKDEKSGFIKIIGSEYVDTITNHNGAELELGLFTDARMKEISAVIFSNTATMTKVQALQAANHPNATFQAVRYQKNEFETPHLIVAQGGSYHESLLDGLHIFLNPFAEHPFKPNLFLNKDVAFHYYNHKTKEAIDIVEDGFLISHQCIWNVAAENIITKKSAKKNIYKNYAVNWEEDKLHKLSATVGTGVNNHIAHYNGWTIVVFQDQIDQDWYAYAKEKLAYNIQDFINFGCKHNFLYPTSHEFFSTKLEAYKAIKEAVDLQKKNKPPKKGKKKLTKREANKQERQRKKMCRHK